ncbi:L-threonylcarbamoyladenylate synthase [Salicibibacter kimchii]|uniref:Threonylcarbamoyl-AMP synthase n=1 Tax=Salicibibacter kimchii TaxID=2099786 RepID=A0A345BZL1_9BACI|nr:L-threonylcarbamoyladenylate synthase [Salicibibacter kimchii]AXF56392.1 threonylcarbamoyl-AMP synthase [Salicibibacter kimchii]
MSYQQTDHLVVDNHVDEQTFQDCVEKAARILRAEELVAFPTETVYGLGANGLSTRAVQKIFKAKGRPNDNPLILHIGSMAQLYPLIRGSLSFHAEKLIEHFWPGPLTLIFPASARVPSVVTGGLETVAVRMPAHRLAREIISKAGLPIAAPSANRSGKPSPTRVEHVKEDLDGRVAAIMDGGSTGYGLESTVVDVSGGEDSPRILRPGGITEEEMEETLGLSMSVERRDGTRGNVRAPGMKYRHYSPDTNVELVDGSYVVMQARIGEAKMEGKRVAAAITSDRVDKISADEILVLGDETDLQAISSHLYDHLRAVDKMDVDVLFVQTFTETGIGKAIMNRLYKAANR